MPGVDQPIHLVLKISHLVTLFLLETQEICYWNESLHPIYALKLPNNLVKGTARLAICPDFFPEALACQQRAWPLGWKIVSLLRNHILNPRTSVEQFLKNFHWLVARCTDMPHILGYVLCVLKTIMQIYLKSYPENLFWWLKIIHAGFVCWMWEVQNIFLSGLKKKITVSYEMSLVHEALSDGEILFSKLQLRNTLGKVVSCRLICIPWSL